MKTLLLIPILLLAGCVAMNKPLYNLQPEIVKVDEQLAIVKFKLGVITRFGSDIDLVATRRHIDIIHAFYIAMEQAFADGDNEKFELMMNRLNAQISALDRLIDAAQPKDSMDLIVPGGTL